MVLKSQGILFARNFTGLLEQQLSLICAWNINISQPSILNTAPNWANCQVRKAQHWKLLKPGSTIFLEYPLLISDCKDIVWQQQQQQAEVEVAEQQQA